jgi:hypothetical protein
MFLNLHLASGNSDSAHHTFGNKNNKKSKKRITSSCSSSSKHSPSSSKDAAFSSKTKTYTWCTKHQLSKSSKYGWHECSKLKEFNKSGPKDKGKGNEQHVARYNLNTDSEIEGRNHQNAKVCTPTKWILDSRASTHRMPDAILF